MICSTSVAHFLFCSTGCRCKNGIPCFCFIGLEGDRCRLLAIGARCRPGVEEYRSQPPRQFPATRENAKTDSRSRVVGEAADKAGAVAETADEAGAEGGAGNEEVAIFYPTKSMNKWRISFREIRPRKLRRGSPRAKRISPRVPTRIRKHV